MTPIRRSAGLGTYSLPPVTIPFMDDREFEAAADECLAKVAKWLEGFDPDEADYSAADGSITIEFPDGAKFILSRQSATRQVWLAAQAHGWHYDFNPAARRWSDDKDGHDLYGRLAEVVGERIGRSVEFAG